MKKSNEIKFVRPNNTDNGLVLYYQHNNYYSQKILMTLYEKQIKFTTYEIDIINGENYSTWFLELNPKGEIPVLQDGLLIIPGTPQIINYIETKYNDEPKLLPKDSKTAQKVLYFSKLLNRIPVGPISMGSFIHTDLGLHSKPPFIGFIRESFLKFDESIEKMLEFYAKQNPTYENMLLRKAEVHRIKRKLVSDKEEFLKVLNAIDSIFVEIEKQLELNETKWLCSDAITLADISLSVLLHRLYLLGFDDYFWSSKNNCKLYIQNYYNKISLRESFKKSFPSKFENWKTVWNKSPQSYKIGFGVLSLSSTVLLGAIIYKTIE